MFTCMLDRNRNISMNAQFACCSYFQLTSFSTWRHVTLWNSSPYHFKLPLILLMLGIFFIHYLTITLITQHMRYLPLSRQRIRCLLLQNTAPLNLLMCLLVLLSYSIMISHYFKKLLYCYISLKHIVLHHNSFQKG